MGTVSELDQVGVEQSFAVMSDNPPLLTTFKTLFDGQLPLEIDEAETTDITDLPLIDLSQLNNPIEAEECKKAITVAASTWGFFQVVNHGISDQLLESLRTEQMQLFSLPFSMKANQLLDLSNDCYRWGNPKATNPKNFSWSEAYHIPLTIVNEASKNRATSCAIDTLSASMFKLARLLSDVLSEDLGYEAQYINENCTNNSCFIRLNHYPPCPLSYKVFGMVPHTDSDFLTILCQDNITGLQLLKDRKWFTVKPNPKALVINIGDLFQAWSNDEYKSVEHRVISNSNVDRFTLAYFFCPSSETIIQSSIKPAIYRKFSFGEYRQQIQLDVQLTGIKVGLSRFLM